MSRNVSTSRADSPAKCDRTVGLSLTSTLRNFEKQPSATTVRGARTSYRQVHVYDLHSRLLYTSSTRRVLYRLHTGSALTRFSKGQGVNLKRAFSARRRSTIKKAPTTVVSAFFINILMIVFVMVTCLMVSTAAYIQFICRTIGYKLPPNCFEFWQKGCFLFGNPKRAGANFET